MLVLHMRISTSDNDNLISKFEHTIKHKCKHSHLCVYKHTPAHDMNVFTHRFHGRLKLSVVQLLAVVKDVLICGVEAGFHTVPDHMGRARGRLQFQNLDTGGSRVDKSMSVYLYITM